jgi:acyl-CoA reductase-like NAD-dependent aldehyde dehydrogenase
MTQSSKPSKRACIFPKPIAIFNSDDPLGATVTREMRIAKEEIFGPVLSILTYRTEAEAIEVANDTDFGLIAYVSSEDPERATRVARKLAAGRVLINTLSHDPFANILGLQEALPGSAQRSSTSSVPLYRS